MRSRLMVILVAVGIFLVLVLLAPGFVVCRDYAYICENTGSRKGHRQWFFGVATRHWYTKTKLEAFMETKHPDKLSYRWTSYAGTGKNIFGDPILFGHGRPGRILHLPSKQLDAYVTSISDSNKLVLYQLFADGSKEQVQAKVDEVWEFLMNESRSTRP